MTNLRGILLILFSMAAFAIEDMLIKSLTMDLPTGQILFLLGLGGALAFGLAAWRRGQPLFRPLLESRTLLIRTLSEGFAAFFFITALSRVDLSITAAVFQATPLAITLGAALFLGEHVGWRRWSAILLGFAGVLLIIRPGLEGFNPSSLLVLGAVAAIAVRDLIAHKLPPEMSSLVVSMHGFGALIFVGPVALLMQSDRALAMDGPQIGYMLGALVVGVSGYLSIVIATRTGDAAVITPFRYTRLIFAMALGMLVFAERPDLLTYAGSALIVASGLYAFLRERRLARQVAPSATA